MALRRTAESIRAFHLGLWKGVPLKRRQPRQEPKLWNDGPKRVHTTRTAQDIANLNKGIEQFARKVEAKPNTRGAVSPLGTGVAKESVTKAQAGAWANRAKMLRGE